MVFCCWESSPTYERPDSMNFPGQRRFVRTQGNALAAAPLGVSDTQQLISGLYR